MLLLPSQVRAAHASSPEPAAEHATRAPCGAPFTGEHVPGAVATSQASHWPEHALVQQTPSTQKPLAHVRASAHATPVAAFGAHPPASQYAPVEQSASVVQLRSMASA